jgi:hypothetical protein
MLFLWMPRVTIRSISKAGEERTKAAGADLGRVPAPQSWGEPEL